MLNVVLLAVQTSDTALGSLDMEIRGNKIALDAADRAIKRINDINNSGGTSKPKF